jgi:hypothetical protein
MIRIGAFDRHLEPLAWWEVELLPAGWYVDELLVEPAAGGVTGTVTSTLSDATLSATGTGPATTSAILIGSSNNPSYRSGFYSPRRGGTPKYPSLWDGCVGAWAPSLGATGSRLFDHSVYGNHGTLTDMDPASDWVVSGGKGALDFDGYDDYIDFGSPQALANSKTSISVWIKPSSLVGYRLIYGLNNFPKLYIDPSGRIVLFSDDAANTILSNNVWTHVVATSDGANTRYFLNGISDGVVANMPWSISASTTLIGKDTASNSQFFFGQLDDIRVYNRALTPSEIQLLATRRGVAYESKRRLAVRSGAASPSGTLAKTLDSVTLTSSGTLAGGAATGSLSSTLADASLSSSGTLASGLTGSVSVTLADATLSANGTLTNAATGSVLSTLADATLSSTGTLAAGASGTVTRTLDNATLSSTGGAAGTVTGSVSSTLAAATCSSTGTLAAGLSGTVVRTLDAVTVSATGTVTNGASGTVTRTLADATLASGGSLSAGLTAQVNRALESCVVSSSGTLASGLTGTLSVQLASATLQSGNVAVGGLRIKVGGEWKNANAFVKVTGTWKNATPYVKVSGVWK